MANKISLSKANIESLHLAFDHYFPEGVLYVSDKPFTSGDFNWNDRASFIDFIYRLTDIKISSDRDIKSIKNAQQKLEDLVNGDKKEVAQGESPDKAKRDVMQAELKEREKKIEESIQKAKNDVKEEIKRQEKLRDELKGKKIYYKTQKSDSVKLPEDLQKELEVLKQSSTNNPKETAIIIEERLYNNLKKSLPQNTPDLEIRTLAKQGSVGIVKGFRGELDLNNILIAHEISKKTNSEILTRAGFSNLEAAQIQNTSQAVALQKVLEYEINRDLATRIFNENVVENIFGPKNLDQLKVNLSPANFEGANPIEVSNFSDQYISSLSKYDFLTSSLKTFTESEIKEKMLTQAMYWAEKSLPEGFIQSAINNQGVQIALNSLGFQVGQPIVWEGTSLFGRVAVQSGYGPIVGELGRFTGIDFGVSVGAGGIGAIAASSYAATTTTVAITGGVMAAEAFAGGAGTAMAAGAAAGSIVPGIGTLIGAIAGFVGGTIAVKAINKVKDKLHNVKDFIVGGTTGLLFGGIAAASGVAGLSWALVGFGVGYRGSKISGGGLPALRATANSFTQGVLNAGWAIGATALEGIAGPLLITLLAFPIVIVLILFIINSGAYVVPQGTSNASSQNEYIEVLKTAEPAGPFKNDQLPLKIKYTIRISAKKTTLTNINITDKCIVMTEKNEQECQSPGTSSPESISPGTPFIYSYESIYNTTYTNALILNTVKVTANVINETSQQTAEGSSSIIIGNPPVGCFEFDKTWANQKQGQSNVSKAIQKMLSAKTYMATLCQGNKKILLSYSSKPVSYGGEIINGGITLYKNGVYLSDLVTLYTLAHESGHIYAQRTNTDEKFADDPQVKKESYICTYPMGKTVPEDFAETIAIYISKVAGSTKAGCMSNFRTQYPSHWSFARNNIFFENLGW